MKKAFIIIVIVVVGLVGLGIMRDMVLRPVIAVVATRVTGAPVHIGGFSLGLLRQTVRIKDFRMYNPAGFPKAVMLSIPNAFVDLELFSMFKGRLHIQKVALELKEIVLVKNKQGNLNVDSLKISQSKKDELAKPSKDLAMQIDLADLNIGRVVSIDEAPGPKPQILVYDIDFRKSYKNINSAQQLMALAISEPLKAAGIKGAAIYGAAMLTGIGFIPVAATALFVEKDYAAQEISLSGQKLFDTSLKVLKEIGQVIQEDKAGLEIKAGVYGADVILKIDKISGGKSRIVISARKYILPKREIASGILYQINKEIR